MMLFTEIYSRAITLFDDPDIQRAYFEDTIKWQKMMYPYLVAGIAQFTNPTKIAYLLVNQEAPSGQIDILTGDGSATYHTDIEPSEGADFSFMVKGKVDAGASYDAVAHEVTFSAPVAEGDECSVEWYKCGGFLADFGQAATANSPKAVIEERVKGILARALVLSWAENEKNFVLDIRNILTDTDFKLYSPANSVKAKVEWVSKLKFEFDSMQNKLCWDLVSRKYQGGNYYV